MSSRSFRFASALRCLLKIRRLAVVALALLAGASSTMAATIFEDGFEGGVLVSNWAVSGTNTGRVTISSDYGPATGQRHLLLDDAVNDAVNSVAEATLVLNLSLKKNVVLTFKAKSLGNEANNPPTGNFTTSRNYDGVAISADGGTTWRSVQSLAAVPTSWQNYSVTLDSSVASLGGTFGAGFRIRFSEYDNASVPIDGIAIDDVSVSADDDLSVVVEMPSPLIEGTGGQTGYVLLSFAPTQPITFTMITSPSGQLALPGAVTVEVGQTSAAFDFSVIDDAASNLTRTVTVTASAPGITSTAGSVTIYDDDVPISTLTIPAQLMEGNYPSSNATVSLDRPPAVPMTINLSASPSDQLSIPSSVTIPAGQTQVVFTILANDDNRIDGNVPVTVSATAPGVQSATAQTVAVDNEQRALSLSLPTTLQEGLVATGTATISGTLATPLVINLVSSNPGALTVPPTVTISPGFTAATFTITAPDNAVKDGSRGVMVSASAFSFTGVSTMITIRDNEIAGYAFSGLTDIVNISAPVAITILATDIEGNAINGGSGTVNLSVVLPDGTTQPLNPPTATFTGGPSWIGNVTIPQVAAAPLMLRAADASGNIGNSQPFDLMRVVALTTADLIWDATRTRFYASLPSAAGGNFANQVVVINPADLQITGSAATGQDPGQLCLTSGGELLYAALGGNGTVSTINPGSMQITSNFAIGTSPSYGTLYAEDISTVAGQPNLLVASQYRKSVSPRHNGVAVYNNGVIRPNKTQDHTGSNRIEPSADPSVFFGYNNESTEYGFRRLKLDANGMSELVVNTTLFGGFNLDIVAQGDTVFSNNGVEVDGLNMRRLGTFGSGGPVRPDLAVNRVYVIEPQSTYSSTFDKIASYEPATLSMIRRLTMPTVTSTPGSFIRWGSNGLAFRTDTALVFINSSRLVPSDPPADLSVTTQASPSPATVASPLTYTVTLTNQGPNAAHGTVLTATLSDSQTLQSAIASAGTASVAGAVITLPIGDLAPGGTITLTITTLPQSAGSLTCTATANSNSIDANFANNTGFKLVSVGFQSAADAVNQLRLTANNIIYDPARGVLWVTIPNTVDAPLGRSLVSINPTTGLISDPIPLNANPRANCIALSGNGRYLYIGLSDSPELHRVDLSTNPYTSTRIALGLNQWSDAAYAEDIEVLDGDGTSVLLTTYGDDGAAVFDGAVRRSTRSGIYTVDRIERTATQNVFVGYDNSDTGFKLSRLSVTAAGVTISQSTSSVISGFGADIRGASNLLVSSTGLLVDSGTLTLKANLGVTGRPCMDLTNGRAYIVNGNALRAFDTSTGNSTGNFTLPTSATGDWSQGVVRWGLDGFAILGNDGKIYLARWSSTIPPLIDSDADHLSDAWEATYFGSLNASPATDSDGDGVRDGFEYLFATSPTQRNGNPLQTVVTKSDGVTVLHLIFPRRTPLVPNGYSYDVSANLQQWTPAQSVVETVLSTQTVGGVQIQTIDAAMTAPTPDHGYVRLKWLGQ